MIAIALMGLLFTACGCLASALTSSQIIAGLVCLGLLLVHFFLGAVTNIFGDTIPAAPLFEFVSSQNHLRDLTRGLVDTRPIAYYLSTTAFFLFLTYHLLDFRRWKP